MSYMWTKEDAEKALSAKIDRARTYPTEWQRLFHSEWQLVFQGESPWLPATANQSVNPSLALFGSIHDAKARLGTCVSFALPIVDTEEEAFQCNFTPPLRRRFRRYTAQRNDWLIFVDSYRERLRSGAIGRWRGKKNTRPDRCALAASIQPRSYGSLRRKASRSTPPVWSSR